MNFECRISKFLTSLFNTSLPAGRFGIGCSILKSLNLMTLTYGADNLAVFFSTNISPRWGPITLTQSHCPLWITPFVEKTIKI
ncbi:hypothetical protein MgSA37_03359 [Mucilaginibacter gotjawali]|uniref:Uncharacterized protein n=2 Tax=Mucilaginibacter gotjawali TaxID=1550579 RepID=A0A839SE14_9SPHI|nr:hypothetical protein [Mucilaginibacter gotjawali]BAU55178.1 hypothetical protein MgSA37_03359 [Mucilaginibacter gotjawali]